MGEGEPDTESALLFSVAQGWGGTTFLRYLFICLYFIYLFIREDTSAVSR